MRNQGRLRLGYFPLPLTRSPENQGLPALPNFAGFDDRSMHRGWGSVPGNYRRNVRAPVRDRVGCVSRGTGGHRCR